AGAVFFIPTNPGGGGASKKEIKKEKMVGTSTTGAPPNLIWVCLGSRTHSITKISTRDKKKTSQKNKISKKQYGIYSGGASAANKNTGTIITQNVMNAASPNNITTGGILVNFENAPQITQNDIGNIIKHDGTNGTTATAFGIALGVVPSNTVTT